MATKFIALALAIATVVALPTKELSEEDYESLWKSFVADHAKVYHPHEVLMRFKVFKDNVQFISNHNANDAETLGYTVGINEFADMTNAEFKRTMTGLNAPQNKDQSNVFVLPEATAASVDWTTKNTVTPIKNQGQCGSCWAFSTTGSVEGINAITTGKLESFSEQELVSCAKSFGNQGCNGGLMDDGFKYIEAKGDVLESKYKYTGKTGKCTNSKTKNPAVKISGYKDVKANSESQLMAAVQKQPVSVAIEADQSGFQFYKSGVFSGKCGQALDHGVLAVGYGTDGGKAYWKVKNSWGTSWGQNGYIMMARNIKNKAGQCGIASQASYPTMSKTLSAPRTVVNLTFKDCGENAHAKVTDVKPHSVTLGGTATITGTGILDADISGATYEISMKGIGGVSLLSNCKGDASKDNTCTVGLGPIKLGTLSFQGVSFPVKKGPISGIPTVLLTLPASLPGFATKTTTLLTATASDGKQLFCVDMMTAPVDMMTSPTDAN